MIVEPGCTEIAGGGVQTSSCVVFVVLRYVAVMCVAVRTLTLAGVTMKVATRSPGATKTFAGTVSAAGLSLFNGMVTPCSVANPRVSVAAAVLPTTTGDGVNVSETRGGAGT